MPCNKSPSSFRETGPFHRTAAPPFSRRRYLSCGPEPEPRPQDEVDDGEDDVCHFLHLLSCLAPFLRNERARTDGRRGKVLIPLEKQAIAGRRGRGEGAALGRKSGENLYSFP